MTRSQLGMRRTALATLLLLVPSICTAQSRRATLRIGELIYDPPSSTTTVTGFDGPTSSTLRIHGPHWMAGMNGDHYQTISEITWGERGDEPCFFAVISHHVADLEDDVLDCNAPPTATRTVSSGVERYYGLVALQVCHNNRNNNRRRLVKGVRATWAARPYLTGDNRMEITRVARMPNCRNWSPVATCPIGTAAPAITVQRESIGGKLSAVGIRLQCYQVQPSCSWYEPESAEDPLCWPNRPRGGPDDDIEHERSGHKTAELRK